jgi:beta-glucoside operon transcriptional antiterminator
MKITRVLNTNSILTQDAAGEEIVLLGAGIGFKKKPGDDVDLAKIEKRFVMKDKSKQEHYQELVNNIPQEYIMVAEQIISLGKNIHNMKLNESIHIALPDHIHMSIVNLQNGITIPNSLLLDIRRFYPNEYEIAVTGLELIKNELGYELPEDEAGFIAMHFVNAQYDKENTNVKKVIELVKVIHKLVLTELNVTPDENSLNYYRYMTHIKFFAQRVIENFHYENDDSTILDSILIRYPKEYMCSRKVCNYVKEHYNYKASHDELIYLTVHLVHLTHK